MVGHPDLLVDNSLGILPTKNTAPDLNRATETGRWKSFMGWSVGKNVGCMLMLMSVVRRYMVLPTRAGNTALRA